MKEIDDARPGILRGGVAGEDENARADDGADAQRREVDGPERAFEALVLERLGLQIGDASAGEQIHAREFHWIGWPRQASFRHKSLLTSSAASDKFHRPFCLGLK